MRSKWILPALAIAAAFTSAPASAQTIAYINALQFDLLSFRTQATSGIFWDDIEYVPDAARLLEVEGNRIFTNLSNLSDPALQGDRLLTYSLDQLGNPTTGDIFDTGSFLGGWIGRTSEESNNVFSVFYQMNGQKEMFEDLQDGSIDGGLIIEPDAEYRANIVTQTRDAANNVIAESQNLIDLKRFDDRTATDFDFGIARDVSADLAVGGRIFYEKDGLDVIREGTNEIVNRSLVGQPVGSPLLVTDRNVESTFGPGEDAFKQAEVGLSLDADFHQWANQSLNARFDIFGTDLTNPGFSNPGTIDFPLTGFANQVDFVRVDAFTTVFGDPALGGGSGGYGDLDNDHENRVTTTSTVGPGPIGTTAIDDERTGIGIGAKLDYDREAAGGESRTWLAMEYKPFDIDATIQQRTLSQNTFFWNGAGFGTPIPGDFEATYTTLEQTNTVSRSGEQTWSTWEIGTRWTKDLSNSVSFGGSLIATRIDQEEDFDQRTETTIVTDRFDDGNAALGNDALAGSGFDPTPAGTSFTERQTVTTSTQLLTVDDEQKITTIRIPVGLQFHFAKKWTWNMGSHHEVNWLERETTVSNPAGTVEQPVTTVTTFNGTVADVVTLGPSDPIESETIVDKAKIHTTTFFYGLEWDATENLSFFINGMFEALGDGNPNPSGLGTNNGRQVGDVDFWRSLAISVKVLL